MSTKTRYKPKDLSPGGSYTTTWKHTSTGLPYGYGTSGDSTPTSLGFISESLSETKDPLKYVVDVLHERLESSYDPCYLGSYQRGARAITVDCTGNFPMWLDMERGPPALSVANLSIVYPKTTDQLLEEARSAFHDVNETDNLLNIIEAGQTLDSMVSIGRMMLQLRDNAKSWISGVKPKARFHKFKSSDISSVYLGWSFGFAPLLSDFKKLARSLPKLRNRLSYLAKQSAQPISVVRSCQGVTTFVPPSSSGYGTWNGQYTDYDHWWKEELHALTSPRLVAGVHGIRSVQYKTAGFQEIDYLLSKYIATGPVSLAWEKVKFSFAVDWFANLTGVIDKLDNVLTGHRKKINYAWTSEKFRFLIPVIFGTYGDRNFDEFAGKPVAQFDILKYHRSPADVSYSPTYAGRFGKKQTALSVALIHQMVANLKR